MTVGVGLRVVRGQDWKWEDQDGGKGHLGTVVDLGVPGQNVVPQQCVVIQWDEGNRNTYRVGYEHAYDLRIYDNAALGVCHKVKCDGDCGEDEIMGFLWKCTTCPDVSLCNICYHDEKHDIKHPFVRLEHPDGKGVTVPKRQVCQRNKVFGIFEGARVVRGPDWRWDNQDGGAEGEVIAIVNFSLESDRDAAEVTWSNGHTNVYRLGYKGALDVKYTHPAQGGSYFPDHLPTLKLSGDLPVSDQISPSVTPPPRKVETEDDGRLKTGDKVSIGCDPDTFKEVQVSIGIFNDGMMDCFGEVGEVVSVDSNGNIVVKFNSGRWTINNLCLQKQAFELGSVVKVDTDKHKVRKVQDDLWSDDMEKIIGKRGVVDSFDEESGDIEVTFGSMTFTLKPDCLVTAFGESPDTISDFEDVDEEVDAVNESFFTTSRERMDHPTDGDKSVVSDDENESDKLAATPKLSEAVVKGDAETVKEILQDAPRLVNSFTNQTPILHTSIKMGHTKVVETLLNFNADLEKNNEEKDTALLTAVKERQLECVRLLLDKDAKINARNQNGQTSLHISVQNKDGKMLKLLKSKGCDINIQDELGDSAVTDSIETEDHEIMKMIFEWPGVDLAFTNKMGFSPIHYAARKGELFAVQMILRTNLQMLNKQKPDGYGPLHLVACMDHQDIAEYLIRQEGIDLDLRTRDENLTPLHIACRYGSSKTAVLLVNAEQNRMSIGLVAVDKMGNNALHHCLMRKPEIMEMARMQKDDQINKHNDQLANRQEIVKVLVRAGVPHDTPNNDGITASDVSNCHKELRDQLLKSINEREQQLKSKHVDARPKEIVCKICKEKKKTVPASIKLKPCGCNLCSDCFSQKKPKTTCYCGRKVQSRLTLKK